MIFLVNFTRQIEADSSEQARVKAFDMIVEEGSDCIGVSPDEVPY